MQFFITFKSYRPLFLLCTHSVLNQENERLRVFSWSACNTIGHTVGAQEGLVECSVLGSTFEDNFS